MPTIEIPRTQWSHWLNEFTAIHEGWLVSLDVLGLDLGAQPALENLPLIGISADRTNDGATVSVSVAQPTGDYFTHVMSGVERIWIDRTYDGADAALEFESSDRTRTILRFRAAVRPETVDGVAYPAYRHDA